ncbi:mechanosensitive ion channel family protein [Natronomonas sp. EA1]|uniref:mechanosensitive ion channel family protein n=1 Tax=Natronomonas sp. EA1 TaxID=3421655 RepID=UPI003EBB2851
MIHETVINGPQYLTTVAIVGGYLTLAWLTYSAGKLLKSRFDEDLTEALQAAFLTLTGVGAGITLVLIWDASGDVGDALDTIQFGADTGVKLLVMGLAFAAAYTVTRVTKRLVRIGDSRDAITNHQREVLHHVVQILVFAPALLFAFALWGLNPANLLVGAGVLGIVLGLAARQTLGAVLAGFVILFSRPFEVGDWIQVEDQEGVVTDISTVNTRIRTFDDEMVMIPNDIVANTTVTNRSRNGRLRIEVPIGVDYDTDVDRAAEIAREAMDGLDEIMDGRKPDVVFDRFGDSAVVLRLRFWIRDPTIRRKWNAQNAVVGAVKDAFEREGITIPFPQRTLSGREAGDADGPESVVREVSEGSDE